MNTTRYDRLKEVLDLYNNISEIAGMLAVAIIQGNNELAKRYAKIVLEMYERRVQLERQRETTQNS